MMALPTLKQPLHWLKTSSRPVSWDQKCSLTAMTVLPTQYIGGHEALQHSLDEVKQRLELQDLPVQALIKAGNPAASINAYAEEINANLIVIGAQGLRANPGHSAWAAWPSRWSSIHTARFWLCALLTQVSSASCW